jgi:hypothetical protein
VPTGSDRRAVEHHASHARASARTTARPSASAERRCIAGTSARCATAAGVRSAALDAEGVRLGDPEEVAATVVPLIGGADREHCLVVLLDTKHRVLRTLTVSIGSIDHTFMTPHGIFRDALLATPPRSSSPTTTRRAIPSRPATTSG